jgi:hypothetical protein
MCGADLSYLDEEESKDEDGNQRPKETGQIT